MYLIEDEWDIIICEEYTYDDMNYVYVNKPLTIKQVSEKPYELADTCIEGKLWKYILEHKTSIISIKKVKNSNMWKLLYG